MAIPGAGPRRFGSGWRLAWSTFFAHLRRPFALIPLMAVVLVVFSFIRMSLSYAVNLVGFGAEGAPQEVLALLNQALWNAFGFMVAPAAMAPWFAGRVLFFHGLKAPWKLILEPLDAPWRWAHLLALGVVWMVAAGALGAYTPQLVERFGGPPVFSMLAATWLITQIVFSVAAAAVWRDQAPAHRALLLGLVYPLRGALPLAGVVLAWVLQILLVVFVILLFVGAPLVYMQLQAYNLRPFGIVLLPVVIFLVPFIFHQRAAMGLAVLEWGEPSPKREKAPPTGLDGASSQDPPANPSP